MVANKRLLEIPVEDWVNLREVFKIDWPEHSYPFIAIENYENLQKDKILDTKIFCLDGDWSDGTFILKDNNNIIFYTLQQSCERLYTALKLFDWSSLDNIHLYFVRHVDVYKKVSSELNLKTGKCFPHYGDTCMYWISQENATCFDYSVPDDCQIRSLTDKDSALVYKLWSQSNSMPESYIKMAIRNNPSRGLFGKMDGELRSWVLCHSNGVLLSLQTAPEHLRKGYAEIIIKSMVQFKAGIGQDTIGCVIPKNTNSNNLFRKLHFRIIHDKFCVNEDFSPLK